jgi:hypothetical protein
MKDGILLLLTGLICAFFGYIVWNIAGNNDWDILLTLLLAGLLIDNFYLRRQLQNRQEDKAVELSKTMLHIGFCYFVAPICLFLLLIFEPTYREYPYVRIFAGALMFLAVVAPVFMMVRKHGYLTRLSLYLCVLIVVLLFVPIYWEPTPKFIGNGFASSWFEEKHHKNNNARSFADRLSSRLLGKSRYELINEDEAVFFHPDPPVMLFVSLKENNPHCMGYPQSAERGCAERLAKLVQEKAEADKSAVSANTETKP